MANKATSTTCTCHSCDNPYFVRAQIIAKSAGSPAYRFGIDESVSLPGNQHGFVRDILDGEKIYVVQMFESTEYRCYAWLDMRPEYGYKDIGSVYGKPNPYKPLSVSNYNHTVRFLLGFLYFYDVDLTPGYQSRHAWNEARKVAYLSDIFAGKNAGEIVFQEIPSSDPMPKYQLIKGEQEAITLREFYENRLLYKKACYNDIRADNIFWFKHTMLRMIVYNAKHEPSTEHENIAIIGGILFGRY